MTPVTVLSSTIDTSGMCSVSGRASRGRSSGDSSDDWSKLNSPGGGMSFPLCC